MQSIDEIEGIPVRLTQERFAGVGNYAAPPKVISSFDMLEEVSINPDNPDHIIPKRSDLDTLFPVE